MLFLNGLSYLAVALIEFYISFSLSREKPITRKVGDIIGVNGIFYLVFALLNFSWVFRLLDPTKQDFILMSFVLAVINSILILYAVYKITGNRNLIYLVVLFLVSVFAINFSMNSFFLLSMAISYLLLVIVFLDIMFFSNLYLSKAGVMGFFYTISSLILLVLAYYNFNPVYLPWMIPNGFMLLALHSIFLYIKSVGIAENKKHYKKEKFAISIAYEFIKFSASTLSITAFILLSVIGLHEFGHAMVAQYYGCDHTKAVIYDVVQAPHTEVICDYYYNDTLLTLGGILATFVIGIVFLITGGEFTTLISYLIMGFSVLISYGDFTELGISKNITWTLALLSLAAIIISLVKLSEYQLKQQNFLRYRFRSILKKGKDKSYETKKIIKYENKGSSNKNNFGNK
jgi:hypothetical protein